jgi:hypothetical protein
MNFARIARYARQAFGVGIVSAAFVAVAWQASPDQNSPVTIQFFGMHLKDFAHYPWPTVPFSAWRVTVAWKNVEPQKGVWDLAQTDAEVEAATQHRVDLLFNLGFTPNWASSAPDRVCVVGKGACVEPKNMEDWRNYVRTLATRYKGKVKYYEIWNEPDDTTFWNGTDAGLVQLSKATYEVLKAVDPSIQVLSPAPGSPAGLALLDRLFSAGDGEYFDIVAYHPYVSPEPPESLYRYVQQIHQLMQKHGLGQKPLWVTEIGWATKPMPDSVQAAYVAETFLLLRAAGASRAFWYQWGNRNENTLYLVNEDNKTLTPAGLAFKVTEDWMLGAVVTSCDSADKPEIKKASHSLWTCKLDREGKTSYVVWNPDGGVKFTVPPSWKVNRIRSLENVDKPLPASREEMLGHQPVLFDQE